MSHIQASRYCVYMCHGRFKIEAVLIRTVVGRVRFVKFMVKGSDSEVEDEGIKIKD